MAHSVFRKCRKNPGIFEKYRIFSTFSQNSPNFFPETSRGLNFSWKITNFWGYRISPKPPRIPLWKPNFWPNFNFQFQINRGDPVEIFEKFFLANLTNLSTKIEFSAPKNTPGQISAQSAHPNPPKSQKNAKNPFSPYLYIKKFGVRNRDYNIAQEWLFVATWNQKTKCIWTNLETFYPGANLKFLGRTVEKSKSL